MGHFSVETAILPGQLSVEINIVLNALVGEAYTPFVWPLPLARRPLKSRRPASKVPGDGVSRILRLPAAASRAVDLSGGVAAIAGS
jgi:hypothetical protein